ncbi:MAG TPA: hypothetical protein VGN12_06035 [Pirellulales bacterium]
MVVRPIANIVFPLKILKNFDDHLNRKVGKGSHACFFDHGTNTAQGQFIVLVGIRLAVEVRLVRTDMRRNCRLASFGPLLLGPVDQTSTYPVAMILTLGGQLLRQAFVREAAQRAAPAVTIDVAVVPILARLAVSVRTLEYRCHWLFPPPSIFARLRRGATLSDPTFN